YTFVSFAKKEYTRRIYNPNTTFYYTVTDYGALHWKKDVTITAGKKTALNIILTNLFAELTVTLNSGNIGNITSINSGRFSPTYSFFDSEIDEFTGEVTFGGGFYNGVSFSFLSNSPSSIWKSDPVPLLLDYTESGKIELEGVVINNI